MTLSIVSGRSLLRQFRFLPSSSLARRSIVAIGSSGRGIASTSALASTPSEHVQAHAPAESAIVPPPRVVHLPLTEWPSQAASMASIPSPADPQTIEPPTSTSPSYVTLPAHVFASPSRPDILHRCVVTHLSNLRQGTARTKNRAETKGSNRKIMRQKGTGKARVGDIRSPIRRGGGRAFPKRERDWTLGLNRKVWELGVRTALSERWRRGELAVIPTSPILAEISTRALSQSLRSSPFAIGASSHKTLFLVSDLNAEFVLSAQNLPNVEVAHISEIEVYPLLQGQRVVLDVDAVQYLEDWLGEDTQRVAGRSYVEDGDTESTAVDPESAMASLAEALESAGVLEGEAATIMAEFENGSGGAPGGDGQTSSDSLGGGYKDQDVAVEGEEAGVQEQRHPEDPLKQKDEESSSDDKGEAIREEMEKVGEEQKKKGTEDADRPNLKDVL